MVMDPTTLAFDTDFTPSGVETQIQEIFKIKTMTTQDVRSSIKTIELNIGCHFETELTGTLNPSFADPVFDE